MLLRSSGPVGRGWLRRGAHTTPRFPCTGATFVEGFGGYVAEQLEKAPPRTNLTAFSKALEERFGWPRVSLTNSGSSANLAAALTLSEVVQTKRGVALSELHRAPVGRVLTAAFTFPSTMASLQTAGFELYLVDTEEGGFCMSPAALGAAIASTQDSPSPPVAVCVTHFLGFPAQLRAIAGLCRAHGLLLLQDACETMDLSVDGVPAHQHGDISAWSFYHPHHLSSFGGGAVSSPHAHYQEITESVTHWGRLCTCHLDPQRCRAPQAMHHHFHYVRPGHNLEMSELNACFGRFQLQRWPADERKRLLHYDLLYGLLHSSSKRARVWAQPADCGSPFVFPVQVLSQDPAYVTAVQQAIIAEGVEIRSLMGGGAHGQPAWATVPHDGLPVSRRVSESSFFVGIHQTLDTENVRQVGQIIHSILQKV